MGLLLSVLIGFNILASTNISYGKEVIQNRLDIAYVTASSDDGNVPANTIDNVIDTRWSAKGPDEWIRYDLGSQQTIGYVGVAFHKGDIRYTDFDILVSSDDVTWKEVFSGRGSGTTMDMEKFDIEDITAQYVKLICHGYTYTDGSKTGEWNSLNEVHFYPSDDVPFDAINELEPETPIDITYTKAGFYEGISPQDNPNDIPVHDVHKPNDVTGTILNVVDFGADIGDNGANDVGAIQAAINAAQYGDEVYLPNGIYHLQSDAGYALKLKSGVNLRGESQEGTKLIICGKDGYYPSSVIKAMGQHDILVSNMTITSDFSGNYSLDHISNNPDASGSRYGIQIEDNAMNEPSYNITMDQLILEKYQTMGVRISNSHDIVVKQSIFQNATDIGGGGAGYGVSIQGEGNNIDRLGYLNDSRFNLVEDCTFLGPYLRHGVLIQYYSHNNVIRHNTFIQTKLDAIDLHGEDEYLNDIHHNDIRSIETGAGIGVGNSGATHDKSGPGNVIHHNHIDNCREGIKVHLGSEDTLIRDNTITGATVNRAKGIYLQNAPGTLVQNNHIYNNTSYDFVGVLLAYDKGTNGRGYGSPHNIRIEENTLENCTNGIRLTSGTDITVQNNSYFNILDTPFLDSRTYKYAASKLPSQILDLTNWKLTLPINNAQEIKQPALMDYEHDDYFHANTDGNGVLFKAHCGGETTSGSGYPRSELREMANNGTTRASWSTNSGKHVMTMDLRITHIPDVKRHVVVGQIHDASDDVMMIRLENNRLFVEAEGEDVGLLDANYQLGSRFTIKIEAENDIIKVYYNQDEKVTYDVKDSPTTTGNSKHGCYFKAGMYTQSNTEKGDKPTAYGESEIYDLVVTHSESSNNDTPNNEADVTMNPVMDTYIELASKNPNTTPYHDKDTMYVKMSSGQTTIRIGFIEFDKRSINNNIHAAQLKLTKHSLKKADSAITVYGLPTTFSKTLVWTDLFTADSRYSKNDNTDIPKWLSKHAVKIGVINFGLNDNDTDYTLDVSGFVNDHLDTDQFTFVLLDETGANSDLKLGTSENTTKAPELKVWYKTP